MSSRRTGKIANALLVLGSVLVTLVGFEGFLVWENRFDPRPGSSLKVQGKEYLFQHPVEGLFEPRRSATTKSRVYLLGDSFVAGLACVKQRQDVSGHLQALVGNGIEVVNLGVGGKDPSTYIDFLAYFPIGRGDKVVVVLYDNDIHMSRESCELTLRQKDTLPVHVPKFCDALVSDQAVAKDEQGFLRQANQALKRYRTFQLIKEGTHNLPYLAGLFYRTEYVNRWVDFDAEENRWLVSTIPVMKKIAETKGADFLLVYYPNTNAISPDDPRHAVWRNFMEHARLKTQVELHDPYPFFIQQAPKRSMVWSLTDKHPSCEAHSIMARYVGGLISPAKKGGAAR